MKPLPAPDDYFRPALARELERKARSLQVWARGPVLVLRILGGVAALLGAWAGCQGIRAAVLGPIGLALATFCTWLGPHLMARAARLKRGAAELRDQHALHHRSEPGDTVGEFLVREAGVGLAAERQEELTHSRAEPGA